ncbi:type II toxin-antitoxin system antitoxin SocA domain-containing protein [uncultured Brevundimonas sp.]|uniref:Panacea domain-containing protein n=1 Tax=uncultured Brevundimonas sp. TaxID=213418 RepID=UPI0026074F63|nr:type II toxin-antitoxin system antitoxin SocA domain-containing protein [uncultured Brevundimonas sp.]
MPISNVITVADDILRAAKARGFSLTPMQLMKLTYIAHGYSLGLGHGDLFGERIEAWKYGPVIPDLYHATKRWGRDPIPLDRIEDGRALDGHAARTIDQVLDKYGKMSGPQLSNLTHKAGTPWSEVYREGCLNIEIKDSNIERHYRELLGE